MSKTTPFFLSAAVLVGAAWLASVGSKPAEAGAPPAASVTGEDLNGPADGATTSVSRARRSPSTIGGKGAKPGTPLVAIPPISTAEQRRMQHQRAAYQKLSKLESPSSHQLQVMRRMETANRYPAHNRAVTEASLDPVLRHRAPPVRTQKSPDGQQALSVWCDRNEVASGSPVNIFASAVSAPASEVSAPERLPTVPSGRVVDADGTPISALSFNAEQDGNMRATFETTGLRPGIFRAEVQAGEGLAETLVFSVYRAHVQLTGHYRDRVEDGQLIVEAEVSVDKAGMYLISGSLYADAATPLGYSAGRAQLQEGSHWMPLHFHGRLLHDAGLAGPYRFEHVHVARRSLPASGGDDADPAFATQAYELDAFSAAPYNDLNAPAEI